MTHAQALEKLCRLCGGSIRKYRVSYSCTVFREPLQEEFAIDILQDLCYCPQKHQYKISCSSINKSSPMHQSHLRCT